MTPVSNTQHGPAPSGPDEGQYDVRKGAAAYSSIVASVGSLAVTAIVVIFTVANDVPKPIIALATGLLAIAFMGSLLGAFGFAAIGAENDPTANLAGAVLFASVPTSMALLGTLGAFEVLAAIYVSESARLFLVIVGAGGTFAIVFTAVSIADSVGLHPRLMNAQQLRAWRGRQWLKTRHQALRVTWTVIGTCATPVIVLTTLRYFEVISQADLSATQVNWELAVGVAICLGGGLGSLVVHPHMGNDQRSLGRFRAWAPLILIMVFTCILVITLPTHVALLRPHA